MNKSLIGSVFILVASILFSTRYIVASIAFVNYDEFSEILFKQILNDTVNLLVLSIISLIIGVIILLMNYIERKK